MSKEPEALTTMTYYDPEIDGKKININYQENLKAYTIIEETPKRNEPVKLLKVKKYLHDECYVLFGKCPVCNHYNLFTSNYCSNCSQALERIEKEE